MTTEQADKKTLTISVAPRTHERLERRAAVNDLTVDQYVFDLVVRDAYAPGRLQRLWESLPSWCSGLAMVLFVGGYFTHADAALPVAFGLIVVAVATAIAESERRRRQLQAGIRVETHWTGPSGADG